MKLYPKRQNLAKEKNSLFSNSSPFGPFLFWKNKWVLNFLILSIFVLPNSIRGESQISSVNKVKIPRFNDDGFVSWELHASKITQKADNIFHSIDPVLYFFSNQILETTAKSKSGEFFIDKGEARGREMFEVLGEGFNARGRNWSWESKARAGENQIKFKEQANVVFFNGLNDFFVNNREISESNCSPDNLDNNVTSEKEALIPTIANADYLEFLTVDENTHRFLLDGNVSISGNNLFLTCDKIEVLFTKDGNSTGTPIGEVSIMDAFDNVMLQQSGRTSYAEQMTLDVKAGTALLVGSARVIDDEWGEASGEKIILEKGNRMAKVVAGKNGRSKLELPPLPNLGFGKKSKKTNFK